MDALAKFKKHRDSSFNELVLMVKNEVPLAISIAKDTSTWYDVQKYGNQISEKAATIITMNWVISCLEKE